MKKTVSLGQAVTVREAVLPERVQEALGAVSYTHLTLPTTPYV